MQISRELAEKQIIEPPKQITKTDQINSLILERSKKKGRSRGTLSDGYYDGYGQYEYHNHHGHGIENMLIVLLISIIGTTAVCCFIMVILALFSFVAGSLYDQKMRGNNYKKDKIACSIISADGDDEQV